MTLQFLDAAPNGAIYIDAAQQAQSGCDTQTWSVQDQRAMETGSPSWKPNSRD